jgi:hypothetical protein
VSGVSSVVVARYVGFQHTNLVEHLVTLIEHKALDVAQTEVLVAHKGVQTTGSGDNDVRVGLLVLKNVDVVLDGSATIEDGGLDVRQVLAETGVLVLDLESQLAGVAHDQHRALAVDGLDLLKGGQDENGSFTKTRLGLTKDVGSKNCLRNAVLLDCGYRMSDIGQKINASASVVSIHLRNQAVPPLQQHPHDPTECARPLQTPFSFSLGRANVFHSFEL